MSYTQVMVVVATLVVGLIVQFVLARYLFRVTDVRRALSAYSTGQMMAAMSAVAATPGAIALWLVSRSVGDYPDELCAMIFVAFLVNVIVASCWPDKTAAK